MSCFVTVIFQINLIFAALFISKKKGVSTPYAHTAMVQLFIRLPLILLLALSTSIFAQKGKSVFALPQKASQTVEVRPVAPILISVVQPYQEFTGELFVNRPYTAIRIGEYYWMNQNLSEHIPHLYAKPWQSGTSWTGDESTMPMTQALLDRDMDRLFIDKSQYQININDFHKYYGRYYTRTDVEYFARGNNLTVLEGHDKRKTAWKVPKNEDYRQLFAMCPVPADGSLGQIAVRTTLSYKRKENPLAYDIYDPKGGTVHRTYWFEYSSNLLGFNMMPGGSRMPADGWMNNGLGPNDGSWWCNTGDIYHLFHTAKYATDGSQVTIHDWLATKEGTSWHWYNVRFCRELTDEELGYKLYINVENYNEGYAQTIKNLKVSDVQILELGIDEQPPIGFYELPKGYLRGFYVQYVLGKNRPERYIKQVVEYLKQVDDDIFYDEQGKRVPYEKEKSPLDLVPSANVYPNPMETTLHVDIDDMDDEIKSIRINNFYGLQVQQLNNLERYNDIDVSRLPVGLYILQVETAKGTSSYKLVKK